MERDLVPAVLSQVLVENDLVPAVLSQAEVHKIPSDQSQMVID